MIHRLELPIQAQDLIKAYQTSTCFCDVYHYITDRKLPSGAKAQACIQAEALNYVVINNFLFRIDTHKDKDQDRFFIHNLMNKVKRYIKACHTCLKTKPKYKKNRPIYVDYVLMQDLSIDVKHMPMAFGGSQNLLVITCDQTNFTIVTPLQSRDAQSIAEAWIYQIIYLFGPPRQIICDERAEFTSHIVQAILHMAHPPI